MIKNLKVCLLFCFIISAYTLLDKENTKRRKSFGLKLLEVFDKIYDEQPIESFDESELELVVKSLSNFIINKFGLQKSPKLKITDLFKNFSSKVITKLNEIKQNTNQVKDPNVNKDSILCKPCHFIMVQIDRLMNKKYGFKFLKNVLSSICSLVLDKSVCYGAIYRYGDIIYDALIDHYFDSEFVCTKIGVCDKHYIELDADDFAREVLKGKPQTEVPTFPSEKTLKVLHLADMHIDMFYQEGSEADCGDPFCCRDIKENPKHKAGYFGSLAACDLPEHTIQEILDFIATEIKPDLVLWTGDNGSHDVWQLPPETASLSTHFIGKQIYERLVLKNNITLVPSIGNHEEKEVDIFNVYNLTQEQTLLKNISEVYQLFIGEEKAKEFEKSGYFTMKYGKNLRIISLNCFACDGVDFYLIRDPTDPLNQIEWLRSELQKAEENGEKVFIIGHIPPGEWSFLTECNKRYNALQDRYQNIIRGQFFAHTHFDQITLMKSYFNSSIVTGVNFVAPSLTTYSSVNPSFRVFEVDPETWYMKDLKTYRLDIEKANKNKDLPLQLEETLTFNQIYGSKHLYDYDKILETTEKVKTDNETFRTILDMFFHGGTDVQKYWNSNVMKISIYCRTVSPTFAEYWKCANYKTCNIFI